ncbi:DegT/DnrJ/EryC1/StrS family aminotransferase [Propionispora vibrioides]|uniref:DegT/DnrJ/EryC1/StrS aminotransferase family protein n=1 Tax=Propionispora vibrioides TaxID=112903 RepID=A0A1H8S157_9FIRM|nr:DegT/DnrJ/EryC1/StrS family aminotransferase [Propionispora vibrioides]SEO72421.1 DegT/DnrJ/EryC1/StrS aminotransferase family protein [Propionispora vibrioides]
MNNSILTSYGRTALYLALLSIGVQGKKVILPAFTCNTTVPSAIVQAGGYPLFVNVNLSNLGIDTNDLKSKLDKDVIAIISHHYFGSFNKSVYEIQEISTNAGLIHIEDCAHSLGATDNSRQVGYTGDIAIFSFSKSLNNPAGGAIYFRDLSLKEHANELQEQHKNFFHSFINDYETFKYLSAITKDRNNVEDKMFHYHLYFSRIFIKILKELKIYIPNHFYKIMDNQNKGSYPVFDTRMTVKQKNYIESSINNLQNIIQKRQMIASKLDKIIPAYLRDFEGNTFTQYVVKHSNVCKLEDIFRKINIKTRRVWPAFQPMWSGQYNSNIEYLKNHLLLVDLDFITDEKIIKLEKLL